MCEIHVYAETSPFDSAKPKKFFFCPQFRLTTHKTARGRQHLDERVWVASANERSILCVAPLCERREKEKTCDYEKTSRNLTLATFVVDTQLTPLHNLGVQLLPRVIAGASWFETSYSAYLVFQVKRLRKREVLG